MVSTQLKTMLINLRIISPSIELKIRHVQFWGPWTPFSLVVHSFLGETHVCKHLPASPDPCGWNTLNCPPSKPPTNVATPPDRHLSSRTETKRHFHIVQGPFGTAPVTTVKVMGRVRWSPLGNIGPGENEGFLKQKWMFFLWVQKGMKQKE